MEETRNSPYSNGEDRISRLPNGLIHHIFSSIDTKYAVQTSVLSKRWIHIWKSLPFLNFDRRSFSEDEEHDEKFVYFVDMVFILCDFNYDIHRFDLTWFNIRYVEIMKKHVGRWMVHAVRHNVQEITILNCKDHSAYEIPHQILNCNSLRELTMQVYGRAEFADFSLPSSISLPQLKVLQLAGLSISNVESSKWLFSSCPVLEMLVISECDIQTDNPRNLIVDSLSLKKFGYTHRNLYILPQNDTAANIINLSAPNLEEFTFRSLLAYDCSLENSSPLSKVEFDMTLKVIEEDENAEAYLKLPSEEKEVYAKRMMKFLGAVYMAKQLSLSPGFLEVLSEAPDLLDSQQPRLCNLKLVNFEMWSTRGRLRAIAYLLKISPNINAIYL